MSDPSTHSNGDFELVEMFSHEDIPTEYLLDEHPMNDHYLADIEKLKRQIVRHSDKLRPAQVKAVKFKHRGYSNTAIAEKMGKKPANVSQMLLNPNCRQLLALLRYLQLALEGPQESQRRAMLWRIAEANEQDDPRCAISAIAELNKMDNNAQTLEALKQGHGQNSGRIEIVVSSPALARTVLDG